MLYHFIYNVRYYPRIHVPVVGLGTYYPQIQGSAYTVFCYVTILYFTQLNSSF